VSHGKASVTDAAADTTIETDTRVIAAATIAALAQDGVNRASLGALDFDPKVQRLAESARHRTNWNSADFRVI